MNEESVSQIIATARSAGRAALSYLETKRILEAIGVPTAVAEAAAGSDEAALIAERIGFPVVLKALSPDVVHKSDVGGVALNLRSAAETREAFKRMKESVARAMPQARFEGVTVESMAPPGTELIVGVTRDDRFGPILMVGLGGVWVEAFEDTAIRLAPVSEAQARAMIDELRGVKLLRGYRGAPAADIGAIASLLARLSHWIAGRDDIAEMDLNPVAVYPNGLKVLDARIALRQPSQPPAADPRAARRIENLKRAFDAQTVAVVGDKRAGGYLWLRAMARFKGKLYSVQIDPQEIAGIEAMGVKNFRSLAEIGEKIDYAVSAVPRQVAPRIIRDCVANGVGSISLFTSGFSETGEEPGTKLEAEIKAIAQQSDLALVGPNCMGLYNPAIGLCNFPDEKVGEVGDVCFISQSGTHTINFCLQAPLRGIKVNKAASIGNAIVLECADYLDLMAEDAATRAIAMYIEGVRDGRRFFESLKRAAARHPVIVWKGGATEAGSRATYSHTASLATQQKVWSALVRQAGAVEVSGLDAMLDAVEFLARGKPLRGRRLGLVAMTGGQSVVITDAFAAAGLEVPALSPGSYEELKQFFNIVGGSYRNPLDAGGTIAMGHHQSNLDRMLEVLKRDPAIDAVVLEIGTGLRAARWANHEDEMLTLLDYLADFNRRSTKPFAVVLHPAHIEALVARARTEARARGLVVFDSFERGAAALRVSAEYWEGRRA